MRFVFIVAWIQDLPAAFFVFLLLLIAFAVLLVLAPAIVCFALYDENKNKLKSQSLDLKTRSNIETGVKVYRVLTILCLVFAGIFGWMVYTHFRDYGW